MHYGRRYTHCVSVFVNRRKRKRNRCRRAGRDLLVYCSLAPTVGVTWPRQSGISGPRSTAPAEVRGGASFAQPPRPEARPAPCLAQLQGRMPEISYSAQRRRLQVAPHSAQLSAAYPAQQWYRACGHLFGSRRSRFSSTGCLLAQPRRRGPGTSYSPQRRRPQVAPHSAQPPASYSAQALQPVVPPASL